MADQSIEQNEGQGQPDPSSIPCQDANASYDDSETVNQSIEQTQGQTESEPSSIPCEDANASDDDVASTSDAATTSSVGENTLEELRQALAEYVICEEMPLHTVVGRGFRTFFNSLEAGYRQIRFGETIVTDCLNLFLEESKKLKEFLQKSCLGVCLTAETWTSIHDFKYVSLTAHFIDENWRHQKLMLDFCMIEDHKGDTIGRRIELCLLKWGIKKLFTLTVNDSNSDVMTYLKHWDWLICDGDYLHVRCYAHILNLVVNDGLRDLCRPISAIRNAIRYVRISSEGLQTFKNVRNEEIESRSLVRLDTVSRWNTTYMMLERALKFQKVFERMEKEDEGYNAYFKEDEDKLSPPTISDWSKVSAFVQFLKVFYDITLRLSQSLHVTSNEFFHDMTLVQDMLQQYTTHEDPLIRDMAKNIKCKYDNYWGKQENLNPLLVIGVVLDPRYKFNYVNLMFENIYLDTEVCAAMKKRVKDTLYRLYEEYSVLVSNEPPEILKDNGESSRMDAGVSTRSSFVYTSLKEKVIKKMRITWDQKTELEKYLTADLVDDDPSFDILVWWKNNAAKYKVLSLIARDVLAVPASATSDYAFRPSERVLEEYRSLLPARLVQALMCTKNWLAAREVKSSDCDFGQKAEPEEGSGASDLEDDEFFMVFE